MSLRSAVEAIVQAAPPSTMVPVSWLAELLANESAPVPVETPVDACVDLTVSQVAERFGKGSSTVRTWLARGELPGAYRLHGREWRIPAAAVASMQQTAARAHRQPAPTPASAESHNLSDWRRHLPKRNAS